MSDWQPQATEATYDGSALRLNRPLPLDKEQRVWVIVLPMSDETDANGGTGTPDEILALAAQVYEGLSLEDLAEIERIARDRTRFFSSRDS